jgi:hypothetical protein
MMRWRASIACDNPARAFDDHDLGGYRIANGVAPFIGGRSERHGEKFLVDHNAACGLIEPENPGCSITSTAGKKSMPAISSSPPQIRCAAHNRSGS